MAEVRRSVSVAGVVVDDQGRALVVRRRDNGRWEPPGGVLEIGERILDGLRRELAEETGLDVEPISATGIYHNLPGGIVALVFRCTAIGGQLRPSNETSEFRWANPDEIPRLMPPAYAARVLDAVASAGISIRDHDGINLL